MRRRTILIVDDEMAIRVMLRQALERGGYGVAEAGSLGEARSLIATTPPDLLLLDWMLPDGTGLDLLHQLREAAETRTLPVIMLTARVAEDDRVLGLQSGVDDYVIKPFSPRELLARIQAVLRRTAGDAATDKIGCGVMELDRDSHRLMLAGEEVAMGPTEFRLLHFFLSHPDRLYTRAQLLDLVWGHGSFIEERTVDVHIRRIRKVLAPFGADQHIETVRGAGYRCRC